MLSPRNVIRNSFFAFPLKYWREESFLTSSLSQRVGEQAYPGDKIDSPNWPGVAPGRYGPMNALSPKYLDLSTFLSISPKPKILWIRGDKDKVVADYSLSDIAVLGREGEIAEWPGDHVFPPQPMIKQTRNFLEGYRRNGGRYCEEVMRDVGHSPFLEAKERFLNLLLSFIESNE